MKRMHIDIQHRYLFFIVLMRHARKENWELFWSSKLGEKRNWKLKIQKWRRLLRRLELYLLLRLGLKWGFFHAHREFQIPLKWNFANQIENCSQIKSNQINRLSYHITIDYWGIAKYCHSSGRIDSFQWRTATVTATIVMVALTAITTAVVATEGDSMIEGIEWIEIEIEIEIEIDRDRLNTEIAIATMITTMEIREEEEQQVSWNRHYFLGPSTMIIKSHNICKYCISHFSLVFLRIHFVPSFQPWLIFE